MVSNKKWGILTLAVTLAILLLASLLVIVVDPFFHFHKPLKALQYHIYNERYQNNGIVKHFDYDAIITGTSMTQNFKTSQLDALFGTKSIKVPFGGGYFKEIGENIQCAIENNNDLEYVFWGIDCGMMELDKDAENYSGYPRYLYDDTFLNDINYLLNKDTLFDAVVMLTYTMSNKKTTTFDAYSNWMAGRTFGKQALDMVYYRAEKATTQVALDPQTKQMVVDNITQNVVETVTKNPNISFYLFLPPYSIYWRDNYNQVGKTIYQLEIEKTVIELLLEYDNVKLFSFYNNFELVTNLDNYKDIIHYSEDVNAQMLQWMQNGEYQLTKDNYLQYCEDVKTFYTTYDYDSMFK